MTQVLIIEDDKIHAEVIAEYLELKGICSHKVYSGNDAIDWLKEHTCQVLVTDIRMPFGSGIDLMQWNSHEGPNLPVVAMSGDIDSDHETQQFCEVMQIPYIGKPLDLQQLSSLVSERLS